MMQKCAENDYFCSRKERKGIVKVEKLKMAILTSGIQPVPAVQGGAVESLIDFYLEYNDRHKLYDITVYSVWHPAVERHPAQQSEVNHYRYLKMDTPWARLRKKWYQKTHGWEYYHHFIEFFLHEVMKDLAHQRYDMIVVENRPAFILKLAAATTTPCMLHLHNDFLHVDAPECRDIFNGYQRIIGVSDFITSRVNAIDPEHPKCRTVHNAIDLQLFCQTEAADRHSAGLSADDFVVVFSGRLTEEKGILQLIQAIKQTGDLPQIKLLIIGASTYGVDKHPTPFMQRLKNEAEAIKEQVVFTGFIDYKAVVSYLKMADIAVIPSVWEEPFGLTVVEAMAAGLPLVTTRSGGIPEICEGIARIVDRDDLVGNLSSAILDLYRNPEKRQQMSAASTEHSKLFDKESYARNFFAALH